MHFNWVLQFKPALLLFFYHLERAQQALNTTVSSHKVDMVSILAKCSIDHLANISGSLAAKHSTVLVTNFIFLAVGV